MLVWGRGGVAQDCQASRDEQAGAWMINAAVFMWFSINFHCLAGDRHRMYCCTAFLEVARALRVGNGKRGSEWLASLHRVRRAGGRAGSAAVACSWGWVQGGAPLAEHSLWLLKKIFPLEFILPFCPLPPLGQAGPKPGRWSQQGVGDQGPCRMGRA